LKPTSTVTIADATLLISRFFATAGAATLASAVRSVTSVLEGVGQGRVNRRVSALV
jgi:hypothetical protein